MTAQSVCSSCGAPILWRRTTTNRPIPLDAEPVPNGNIILQPEGRITVLGPLDVLSSALPRYVSHFATCKDATDWRTKPKPKRRNP